MRHQLILIRAAFAAAFLFAGLALPSVSRAVPIVDSGYDLLTTQSGTTFAGAPFEGVPLGTFNFGGTIGVQNVGNTDTIIQRLAPATGPSSQTIPIAMLALQLVSVNPINLGAGVGFYYITLQSARGGPASTGQMTINFAPQTFTSFFDVFFDVRLGSLNGPIVESTDLVLSNSGTAWSNMAPSGSLLINGVNNDLNGTDTSNDFWPGTITEAHPSGAQHVAGSTTVSTTVPDGGTTLAMLGLALGGLAAVRRKLGMA